MWEIKTLDYSAFTEKAKFLSKNNIDYNKKFLKENLRKLDATYISPDIY